jgi:hypothetical protein
MSIKLAPLHVQLAFYAFTLSLPTAAIKTFSLLSGMSIATGWYLAGAVASVLLFGLFFFYMSMMLTMAPARMPHE